MLPTVRHLSPEELLLYAEGELDEQALCQHVSDCVECKAQLVDLQETYVFAAQAIRIHTQAPPAQPAQLQRLRQRLATEAEMLAAHLSTEDLLLSVENGLGADGQAHLAACTGCQRRAADLHVQLAKIETQLHSQFAFELPAERRAAALAALRVRLEEEVERRTAVAAARWRWLPTFTLPRIPAFAPYAGAFATACLAMLVWSAGSLTERIPAPESLARLAAPAAPELVQRAPVASTAREAARPAPAARRFNLDFAPAPFVPEALAMLAGGAPPEVEPPAQATGTLDLELPSLADLPGIPSAEPELASAVPDRPAPLPSDDATTVVEGRWILVQTGFWKRGFDVGGSGGRIRITGSVSSEQERVEAEGRLLAAAGGQPMDFAISVLAPRPAASGIATTAGVGRSRSAGGLVRASLLEHYQDAARRSFQEPDRSLLESELERYVSEILRHDAELLSHAHALDSLLSRQDIAEAVRTESFPKVARFHLDAISRHEAGIYGLLSEALPRRFWAYRGTDGNDAARPESVGATSSRLREDALALDRALNSLLFAGGDALDARESNLSSATLLARLRQHTRWLKDALRQ